METYDNEELITRRVFGVFSSESRLDLQSEKKGRAGEEEGNSLSHDCTFATREAKASECAAKIT